MTLSGKKMILSGLACIFACQLSYADESTRDYYLNRDKEILLWGTGKKEAYDIAIRLADPGLEGLRVKKISVILPDDFSPENMTGWLTTELTLNEQGDNVANLASVEAVRSGNMLDMEFQEGIEIPAGGLFAGYSFGIATLDEAAKYPITVGEGINPDGFFLHTSRTCLQWKNESARYGIISDMRIELEGNFPEFSVGLDGTNEAFLLPDSEGNIEVSLVNHGTGTPTTITYTMTFPDGYVYESSYVPETPLVPQLEKVNTVLLPVKTPTATGTQKVRFDIVEVNNTANPDRGAVANADVTIMAFVPTRKVLMEEYTGLWCGACPRGYVALEEMHHRDPENFVGISYHNNDHMAVFLSSEYPNYVAGFPSAFLNRKDKVDAYYGDTDGIPMGIEETLERYKEEFTPADVKVSLKFIDSDEPTLEATSISKFVFDREDTDLTLAYMLLTDGLFNEKWIQTSYYTSEPSLVEESPLWEPFVTHEAVTGLIFNDVIVSSPALLGSDGSLPTAIVSDTEYMHSVEFKLSDIINIYGKEFINPEASYRVVAVIIDKNTGEVLNCNTSEAISCGVDNISVDRHVVHTLYYDFAGKPVECDKPGLYIVKTIFDDGSISVTKTLISK